MLSKVLGKLMKLPAPSNAVRIERDLGLPMPDGVTLLAHRYLPEGVENPPLVLVRSPYGRAGLFGVLTGELLAERGLQVLVVSVRGTFGSGGTFFPFHQEKADGVAVLEWMRAQRWYPGRFGTHGPSYLGLTQWALAADAGPELAAMSLQVTASEFRNQTYAGESFSLENALSWGDLISNQEGPLWRVLAHNLFNPRMGRGLAHLPLKDADRVGLGKTVAFYQRWLEHDAPGDPWWKAARHDSTVPSVTAEIQMTTGWHDIFLPWQLEDYAQLKAAGRPPRMTIGPWSHAQLPGLASAVQSAIPFFHHVLGKGPAPGGAPVRIFIPGLDAWRELPFWPPRSTPTRWYLHPKHRLERGEPAESAPEVYRYDPASPTPGVGGALRQQKTSGARDNRALEARADVVTFTGEWLEKDLEIIGTVEAELFVESSLEHTDFFARLCDVHPDGKSVNVCDALIRLRPGAAERQSDGSLTLRFPLWPTAHRFLRGHRVRAQISSGAFPRYARNPGTGEPLATATRLQAADQKIFHQPGRASALILPVSES